MITPQFKKTANGSSPIWLEATKQDVDFGPDREAPDFLVTEGTNQFGLELCEIFTGPQSPRAGSAMKTNDSTWQRLLKSFGVSMKRK